MRQNNIAFKVAAIVSLVVIVLNIGIIAVLYNISFNNFMEQFKKSGEQTLRGIAVSLDGKEALELYEAGDTESDVFLEQHQLLSQIIKEADIKYLYTYVYDTSDGAGHYIVDGGDINSDEWCEIGETEEIGEEFEETFSELSDGQAIISDLEKSEEWGQLLTIEVPLYIEGDSKAVVLAGDFSSQQVTSQSKSFRDKLALCIWLLAVLEIAVIYSVIMKLLGKSMKSLNNMIDRTAALDFSDISLGSDLAGRKDEIGEMTVKLQKMRDTLRQKGSVTESISNEVSQVAQEIREKIAQNTSSTENISQSVTDLASGINVQATASTESSNMSVALGEKISILNEQVQKIVEMVKRAQASSSENNEVIDVLKANAEGNAAITGKVQHKMDKLIKSSEDVQGIMAVIEGVTEETNLLALNAAIEAARAGEAGKSFGVVAQEIKNLSYSTAESTHQIKEIIDTIISEIGGVTEEVAALMSSNEQTGTVMNTMLENVSNVQKMVRNILEETIVINQNMGDIESYKNKSLHAATEMMAMSEEYSAISEEIASSTEEETAVNKAILQEADQLVKAAQVLQESLKDYQF